jgi:hypothetical protein
VHFCAALRIILDSGMVLKLAPKKTSSSKILLDGLLGVPSPLMLLAGWPYSSITT